MECGKTLKFAEELQFLATEGLVPDDLLLETELDFLMREPPVHLPHPFKSQTISKKAEKISIVCCVMGELAFAANDFNNALKYFTNALRFAPSSSKLTGYSYFWRSVVLQKLKAYSESLKDIRRSLKLPINKEEKKNLLDRKKVIENLHPEAPNKEESNEEEVILSYGENSEIKGVSSAVTLSYNEKYGRHYVATQDIKLGDVIMIQQPYSFATIKESNNESNGKHWFCENCLNLTMAPIPCDSCAMNFYCSDKCRFEAYKKYHKYECKIAQLKIPVIPAGPVATLCLRLLLIVTKQGEDFQEIVKLVEVINKCKDRRTAGFRDGKLDGCNSEAVLSLLHHMEKNKFSYVVNNACEIVCALKKHTDFFKKRTDVHSPAKLLVLLSYICLKNMYYLRKDDFLNIIGIGLYPVLNLLNHNCSCNILSYNDKHGNMILRACNDIKKGEQLFVSYITFDVMGMTAKERIYQFQKAKFFTCECEACKNNYSYKFELVGTGIPHEIAKKLIMRPSDEDNLWQFLKSVLKMHNGPCLEAKMIELMIVNAYLGSNIPINLNMFRKIRK